MNGPDWELQVAAVDVLKADTALKALIGDPIRLHQDVPPKPEYPYVTIGEGQNVPDLAECIDGAEIFLTFHVYSRAGGFGETKKIVAAMDAVLHDSDLTLNDYRCVLIQSDGAHYRSDPDNTAHAIATWRAIVEPTDHS
jgi:hypothetical protein